MKKKIILILVVFIFLITGSLFAETKKSKEKPDEKRLQFGFGIHINTPTINDMIQDNYRYKAIMKGWDYTYPDTSDEEMDDIRDLKTSKQRTILTKHILSSMEYGLHFRILWRILMVEINQTLLPSNHYNENNIELTNNALIGIRAPFFVMPYILFGPSLTIGFNYDNFLREKSDDEDEDDYKWKKAALNNTYIDFGIVLKTGLDLKFKHFSFGIYYIYQAKSFDDFEYLYDEFINSGNSKNEAIGNILKNQSRFGLSFTWYFDGERKNKNERKRNRKDKKTRSSISDDIEENED